MKIIIVLLFLSITTNLKAQKDNTWYAFSEKEGYTKGFKNNKGEVMIKPKFMGFTKAEKFRNIIAVMEENEDYKTISYYLLKNGKKIGKDSLYVWDMAFDCESENTIRFRDKKTDKVGFFNSKGNVVIPAIYTEALPFHNGVAVVYNGKKKCTDGTEYNKNRSCEHWYLSANMLLIDKKNNVLIDDFKYNQNLDLYSMKKNDTTALPYRLTQKGTNNNYYSFNNNKKEFKSWLNDLINKIRYDRKNKFNDIISSKSLKEVSMPEIYFYDIKQATGKIHRIASEQLITDNATYFVDTFLAFQKEDADYFIGTANLKTIVANNPFYEKYFNDCGEALEAKYPVLSIISNYKSGEDKFQELFSFLKTDTGFKLISIETLNEIKKK